MSSSSSQPSAFTFAPGDRPKSTIVIPAFAGIKDRLAAIFTDNLVKLIDQLVQCKIHPYVLAMTSNKTARFKLLLSYYKIERPNAAIVRYLELLNSIPISIKENKFVGLRSYFLIGEAFAQLSVILPDNTVLLQMIRGYYDLSRSIQLEVERKGFKRPFLCLLSHLHYILNPVVVATVIEQSEMEEIINPSTF